MADASVIELRPMYLVARDDGLEPASLALDAHIALLIALAGTGSASREGLRAIEERARALCILAELGQRRELSAAADQLFWRAADTAARLIEDDDQ